MKKKFKDTLKLAIDMNNPKVLAWYFTFFVCVCMVVITYLFLITYLMNLRIYKLEHPGLPPKSVLIGV